MAGVSEVLEKIDAFMGSARYLDISARKRFASIKK